MCFSQPKVDLPKPAPVPNRADEANQAAVQTALRRARNQNGSDQTQLTGGLGDPNFGKNVNATQLGRTN